MTIAVKEVDFGEGMKKHIRNIEVQNGVITAREVKEFVRDYIMEETGENPLDVSYLIL